MATTRSRMRKRFDVQRMAEAVKRPGIDPRTWVVTARVDNDPDSISYDEELGWLVDVTFTGGELDGEGPVVARVAQSVASKGNTKIEPVVRDCEVQVVINEGDPNGNVVITGQLHNGGGCEPPATVNELPIDEALALVTHIVRTTFSVEEEYGASRRVQALLLQHLMAQQIFLGGTPLVPPTQPVIKGGQYTGGELAFLTALETWTVAVAGALSSAGFPIVDDQATLVTALGAFRTAIAASLSTRTLVD